MSSPNRYPYSRKKGHALIKTDHKRVLDSNKIVCGNIKTSYIDESLTIRS